jgi:hypothetical protein
MYILVLPVAYTILYTLVPGYPTKAIVIPFIGSLFKDDLFQNREKVMFNMKMNSVPP